MASTPKETTTTTKTEPWDGAKPYLEQQYATIDQAIKNGNPAYYPGSTVIEQSDATKAAQQATINTALAGSPLITNAQSAVNGVTSGSAFDPTGANTLKAGTNYTNDGVAATKSLSDLLSGNPNPATSMLQGTANGEYLNSNPYLDQMVKNANSSLISQYNNEVAPGIDSQFAKAGRSGSGAFASVRNNAETTLTDAMAKNASDIYGQNYATERANQQDAQKTIGSLYDTNAKTALAAAGQLGAQSQAQQDSRNSAASALMSGQNAQANTQLQGAGMAGGLRELDYMDADKLAAVGAQQDAYKDLQLQGDIDRWNYNQNKDINAASQFVSVLNGGGYNTNTTTKPVYSNGLSTGLGALGSLVSIFGMLCDIRAKENIRFIGYMLNGTRVYEFTYKNDPSGQVFEGPMAQEVEITRPHAVREIDGFKRIDHRALIGEPAYV